MKERCDNQKRQFGCTNSANFSTIQNTKFCRIECQKVSTLQRVLSGERSICIPEKKEKSIRRIVWFETCKNKKLSTSWIFGFLFPEQHLSGRKIVTSFLKYFFAVWFSSKSKKINSKNFSSDIYKIHQICVPSQILFWEILELTPSSIKFFMCK